MKRYVVLLTTIVFAGCTPPAHRYNGINKIEIATGYCFGNCQPTVVSIDSSLVYRYYGKEVPDYFSEKPDKKDKLEGYYQGKITEAFWDTLNKRLERINYQKLDTSYEHSVDDQSLEVFIYYGNKVKHIKAQSASLPDSVAATFYNIIRSYQQLQLTATSDSFAFESRVINPPPKPKIDHVKFPPPVVK